MRGLVVLALLAPGLAMGGPARVLLRSGDAASDGLGLDGFRSMAASTSRVAFFGTTSAIVREEGGQLSMVAKTGDSLPPGLAGSFNRVSEPVIGDGGEVAFVATLNSPSGDAGIFLARDAGVVPRVVQAYPAARFTALDLNRGLDLAYRSGNSIRFLPASSDTSIDIAGTSATPPGGGRFRRLGLRPALNDQGVVAFVAEVRNAGVTRTGVYTWTEPVGLMLVAQSGDAGPVAGTYGSFDRRQAVSINDAGEIAFVAAFETAIPGTPFLTRDIGVFLHDRTSGVTRLVTRTRDLVGTELLVNIDDRYVGVNSAGDVAFLGTVQSGRQLVLASGGVLRPLTADVPDGSDLAPRLTDTDQVIWSADGTVGHLDGDVRRVAGPSRAIPVGPGFSAIHASINQAGVGVFSAVREALYLLGARRPRLIAREGDSIAGAGTIASLGAVAVSDEAIVVSARDESGTPIVAKLTGGRLTKLLAAGDPAPGGGTVSLEDQRVSLRGERVLVASGFNDPQGVTALLEVNARSGALAEVIRVGGPGSDGAVLKALVDWTFLGSGVVFAAFLEGDRSGIFALRGARMFALRLGGDPAPGGGIFDSFWSVAASGQRVVFGASLRDETFRIVLGRRGNLRNVVQTGDEVRGGGKIASIGQIALHGSTVVFEAVLPAGDPAGDLVLHALVAKRGRRPVVLVREGDPSPLGGTIAFLRALAPLSATSREVLLTAQLAGAPNAVVLLAVPVRPGG